MVGLASAKAEMKSEFEGVERAGMTLGQQMLAQRDRQAGFRLEWEVRNAARARGADGAEIEKVVARARSEFVLVNGEARALAGDGKTVLRREDGGLVTVEEWVAGAVPVRARAVGTLGPSPVAVAGPLPMKNPFKRGSWNLTEQMRLQRRDPELAARLRAEGER